MPTMKFANINTPQTFVNYSSTSSKTEQINEKNEVNACGMGPPKRSMYMVRVYGEWALKN